MHKEQQNYSTENTSVDRPQEWHHRPTRAQSLVPCRWRIRRDQRLLQQLGLLWPGRQSVHRTGGRRRREVRKARLARRSANNDDAKRKLDVARAKPPLASKSACNTKGLPFLAVQPQIPRLRPETRRLSIRDPDAMMASAATRSWHGSLPGDDGSH